jgi:hypothetical protein
MANCGGPRPMTGREAREYDEKLKALGGPKSKAGRAFIEAEHKRYKAARRQHEREHGFWHMFLHH